MTLQNSLDTYIWLFFRPKHANDRRHWPLALILPYSGTGLLLEERIGLLSLAAPILFYTGPWYCQLNQRRPCGGYIFLNCLISQWSHIFFSIYRIWKLESSAVHPRSWWKREYFLVFSGNRRCTYAFNAANIFHRVATFFFWDLFVSRQFLIRYAITQLTVPRFRMPCFARYARSGKNIK